VQPQSLRSLGVRASPSSGAYAFSVVSSGVIEKFTATNTARISRCSSLGLSQSAWLNAGCEPHFGFGEESGVSVAGHLHVAVADELGDVGE
jgi:hypothetical protein